MAWTLSQLVDATSGVLTGELLGEDPIRFDSVSTDTRTLKSGALYVALKGANFDGHAFIAEAVKQGAVAVLISEPVETIVPSVLVEDTRIALGEFAAWHRQQMQLKALIGVTGSNGKTTTKALLANILAKQAQVLATAGNLNNDYGLPRTLLELTSSDDYAVIEMGANHHREIHYLTKIARPDVAVITLAAGAHLEGFGSLDGVIETKGEIMDGLKPGGTIVLNTDSPGFEVWCAKAKRLDLKVFSFGESEQANVRLVAFQQNHDRIHFTLRLTGLDGAERSVQTSMPMLGFHNAMNAAAAVAACLAVGLTWEHIQPGLEDFDGVAGRLQKSALPQGVLIDDTYNANPASVKAAIRTLAGLPGESVACLGAMAELGAESQSLHEEVARYAKEKGVASLLVFGVAAQSMPEAFGEGGEYFETQDALIARAIQLLEQNQVQNVLVKGSRSTQMEKVSQAIVATVADRNDNG
ncbi:UDP-N-acetylmuramoylalanyl-D-glutamyl-2, 6-diaminopimelate--D-alanyl-D-alanine ligase [Thiomicrospira sp. XS5]|uniref:UDP-N-acetylmuramoyl-tripeptide--D-alanyl-D- alanine ligase n=1 Tax=Thiomicrospira sp. XS5 TaxID=1775636 RepID=UPI0007478779|nr:UDP-N-acetylmuramoyl-tripeptide--D-alanyl-D-alanine ligase [Thiomicrospira sp. XS5]KUJ74718.1 UDP-N-acetylmuramoylalanyl-D-glutamyl-2, 6-diaminopimelate--D-alanyl-D-alanine ligase [Thiomicrospira sp. XS5]